MQPKATTNPHVEAARWAYRFVLGREAESETVIGHWASLGDGRLILAHFAQSPEAGSHRLAGGHPHGSWAISPLGAPAIRAAHRLLFDTVPSDDEIRAALTAHPDLMSFRQAFLASPEFHELAARGPEGSLPAATPPSVAPKVSMDQHMLTILGRSFTMRGNEGDDYWQSLVQGPLDPSLDRLTRLLRAAYPDGGAGRVLADVGANIGVTSLIMAAAAPYHAELLCFEPDARNLALLRQNLAANDLGQARILDYALAERDGLARLRCGGTNAATSALAEPYSRTQSEGAVFREVPVRRLDTVLAELGMERLDFLKIDVEGSESPVMMGASETIARHCPIIFTEFNLWTQMTVGARNPMEVLEEWHGAFNHMVAFHTDGRPFPILDHDGLLWVLHTVLTQRDSVDDLILCDRLDWLDRWE